MIVRDSRPTGSEWKVGQYALIRDGSPGGVDVVRIDQVLSSQVLGEFARQTIDVSKVPSGSGGYPVVGMILGGASL